MSKFVIAVLLSAFVAGGTPVFAQEATTTSSLGDLQTQISSLLETIRSLNEQIAQLREQAQAVEKEVKELRKEFRSQLREGLSSDEVRDLQELLARDLELYPEGLITGFFGPLTRKAVERFQRRHGIEAVGEVGPQTRARLNALIASGAFDSLPRGVAKKLDRLLDSNASTTDDGTDTTTTFGFGKITLCHKQGSGKSTIVVAIPAATAHLLHGDDVGRCDRDHEDKDDDDDDDDDDRDDDKDDHKDDHDGDKNRDQTPPVLSGVLATSTTATQSVIVWNTDEPADSTVRFGTSTPVGTGSGSLVVSESTLIMSHDVLLSGLNASTTYYFFVSSKDKKGNVATSTEMSFSTL